MFLNTLSDSKLRNFFLRNTQKNVFLGYLHKWNAFKMPKMKLATSKFCKDVFLMYLKVFLLKIAFKYVIAHFCSSFASKIHKKAFFSPSPTSEIYVKCPKWIANFKILKMFVLDVLKVVFAKHCFYILPLSKLPKLFDDSMNFHHFRGFFTTPGFSKAENGGFWPPKKKRKYFHNQ